MIATWAIALIESCIARKTTYLFIAQAEELCDHQSGLITDVVHLKKSTYRKHSNTILIMQ